MKIYIRSYCRCGELLQNSPPFKECPKCKTRYINRNISSEEFLEVIKNEVTAVYNKNCK